MHGVGRSVANVREAVELDGDEIDGLVSCVHRDDSVLTVKRSMAQRLLVSELSLANPYLV